MERLNYQGSIEIDVNKRGEFLVAPASGEYSYRFRWTGTGYRGENVSEASDFEADSILDFIDRDSFLLATATAA